MLLLLRRIGKGRQSTAVWEDLAGIRDVSGRQAQDAEEGLARPTFSVLRRRLMQCQAGSRSTFGSPSPWATSRGPDSCTNPAQNRAPRLLTPLQPSLAVCRAQSGRHILCSAVIGQEVAQEATAQPVASRAVRLYQHCSHAQQLAAVWVLLRTHSVLVHTQEGLQRLSAWLGRYCQLQMPRTAQSESMFASFMVQ